MKMENDLDQLWDCEYELETRGWRPETGVEIFHLKSQVSSLRSHVAFKKAAAFLTALVFAWSMICPVSFAETINLEGGTVDVNVQDNVTNWNVTGNPIWNVPEFNVQQGSIYNIAGLGSGSSLALLVNGGNASNIFGTMNLSNLDFILQNIAGINIGGSGMINLNNASLIASTLPLNLSATDFLKRDYQFSGEGGFLSNEGRITGTNADLVAFVANAIENKGVIEVPMGTVALAAGKTVTVGISGDGLVSIGVDEAEANELGLADQIKNTGTISAQGGKVLLSAKAIDGLFDKAINIGAGSNATAVVVADDGVIEFVARGDISNTGTVQAKRGEVKIDATGDVETLGSLEADLLDEKAASFQIGGDYHVVQSYHDNLDDAITYAANANVSGAVNDIANIVINAGVILTLTGNTTFTADSDLNGTGAFTMAATSAIAGGGKNLTIKASQNSTLGIISNVNIFTLDRAKSTTTPVYSSNPTTSAWSNITDFRITNGKLSRFTGSGTAPAPYMIYDVYGLQGMTGYLTSTFKLANNVDAASTSTWNAGSGFVPVGYGHPWLSPRSYFTGSFNGDGKNITGLYINRGSLEAVGLFGSTQGATISNVNLVNANVSGLTYVGALVGFAYTSSVISNSSSTGTVSASDYGAGGLVGRVEGASIYDSHSGADVFAGRSGAGGLLGVAGHLAWDTIERCYATGNVSGVDDNGGLVGHINTADVIDSYATGNVSGNSSIGGLVGSTNGGNVYNSYATGTVSGNANVGGLAGLLDTPYGASGLYNSYSTGAVTGTSSVGGLVGAQNSGTLTNSYYDIDTVHINGEHVLGAGGLYTVQYQDWMANGKTLDVNDYFSKEGGTHYLINDLTDLKNLLGFSSTAESFQLASSIDLASVPGFYIPSLSVTEFDGAGYAISNISLNLPSTSNVGFFGQVTGTAINNLGIVGGTVTGLNNVGGLAGSLTNASISNSYATANVSGANNVGGLLGSASNASISNSNARASVSGTGSVGGLVGSISASYGSASIDNSYAKGTVSGTTNVGGLLGSSSAGYQGSSSVENSYAESNVTGTTSVGGLVGSNGGGGAYGSSSIDNSYSTGDVVGNDQVGGLVGTNVNGYNSSSFIDNSYSTSNVTGVSRVGGLVGYNYADGSGWYGPTKYASITNTYATGTVTGTSSVGGLVGDNHASAIGYYSSAVASIDNSYATGAVTGDDNVGGLVGYSHVSDGGYSSTGAATIDNSYWNTETSGQATTSGGGVGLTTAQMKDQSSFSGWDFNGLWQINAGTSPSFRTWEDMLGDGTLANPFLITTVNQLQHMAYALSKHFKLASDIDASETSTWNDGAGFIPVGNSMRAMSGSFDGNEKTIGGLYINRPSTDYVGLFGNINASVSDLGLLNVNITGRDSVGGLAGIQSFDGDGIGLTNCYTTGAVSGRDMVGGLIGWVYHDNISNSYSNANVTGNIRVGGLAGGVDGWGHTIDNSYATGNVIGADYVGGFMGLNNYHYTVSDSYSTGTVTSSGSQVGGFMGSNVSGWGTMPAPVNSYFTDSSHNNGLGSLTTQSALQSEGHSVYNSGTPWDFSTVWQTLPSSLPVLKWEVNIWSAAGSGIWSDAANWSKGIIPTLGTTVLFNSGTAASTIDAGFAGSINKLYIDTGYTGAITQNTPLTMTGIYSQAAGTFNQAANLSIGGDYVQTGGVFVDASPLSHTFSIGGDFSIPSTSNSFTRYSGAGTANDPYVIRDLYDLQAMKSHLSSSFKLNSSLDASSVATWNSGAGFDPIGDETHAFTGKLEGFGKIISNLKLDRTGSDYIGLFGKIGMGGLVNMLGLEKVSSYGRDHVGGLAGLNEGTLTNVYTTGSFTVMGVNFVGGLVGGNTGSIANAYSSARVVGTDKVGGLAGSNTGTIEKTYAMGHVTGSTNTGGLVGSGDSSKVTSSFWNEKMTGQETSAGGSAGKVIRVTEEVDENGYAILNAEDLEDPNVDMMSSSTFSGWDFGSTWVMDEGGSFPHFQYRYPEGVRGVWGITYDDGGALPVAVDENIALYVNPHSVNLAENPEDDTFKNTDLGTQIDRTKSAADGMYYFVLGKNDVSADDAVIGKIEGYAGLEGNTRAPARTGSIMGLDIWGHRERNILHAFKEPPPIPVVIVVVPQKDEVAVDRSLVDVVSVNPLGNIGMPPVGAPSPAIEIQDETFSMPGAGWMDAQSPDMNMPSQGTISFYENLVPGREPVPVNSGIKVSGVGKSSKSSEDTKATMLSIASEVLQSSGKGTTSSGGSSKSSSEEGKTSASATASSPESSESTAAAEASRDESSLAGEGEASSEESSSGDGTSETAAGESVSSSDESPAAAGSKDAAKPAVQDAARASDFFNAENSKNLLTDVRVIEGEVYTIDGANEISLLDPGESLRVNFKAHSSSDLQPLSVVKADPPSLMAVEADPVRPMVKDDAGAAVVRDDVSAMTVDLPASTVREEPSVPVVKPSSVETIVPPAPKDVVESALPPSVTELEKSGTRYGTLKDPGKDVFVKCRGGEWQAAKDGMVILPGDQVRTSANSSVEVLLDGNKTAQVEVKEGSLFRINKAETDPVTGDKTTLLDLAMGKVLVHVEKLEGRSKFEVKTPTALTGVRGTTFEVTVKEKL